MPLPKGRRYAPPAVSATPTIELQLQGPEASWITRALVDAGFEVRRAEAKASPKGDGAGDANETSTAQGDGAAALIVDGEQDGLVACGQQHQGLLVVVGWEKLSPDVAKALPPFSFYERPVPIRRMVQELQARLLPADPAQEGAAEDVAFEDTASAPTNGLVSTGRMASEKPRRVIESELPPREPTVHLEEESALPPRVRTVRLPDEMAEAEGTFSGRIGSPSGKVGATDPTDPNTALGNGSKSPSSAPPAAFTGVVRVDTETRSSAGALDAPEAETGTGDRFVDDSLQLSPELNGLLRAADKRLFPGEDPLDLHFPVGKENVLELVPDELLAEVAMPLEVQTGADPLEAFTFVGTPDLLDTASGKKADGEYTPHTVHSLPRELSRDGSRALSSASSTGETGGRQVTDLTREGLLPAGGALRLLWQLRKSRGVELRLERPGKGEVTLTIARGKLMAMRGEVFGRTAAYLRAQGILHALTQDEPESEEAIDALEAQGTLSPFRKERLLRRTREQLLGELCMAPECRFVVSDHRQDGPSLLHEDVFFASVSVLRDRLGAGDAMRWLGVDQHALVWLAPHFDEAASTLRLEPEMRAALRAYTGRPVGDFLGSEAASDGAAGLLFALGSAEALRFEAGESQSRNHATLRERIERAHAHALEGDYFRILDVRRSATTREIKEAYQLQLRALAPLDLAAVGLEAMEGARHEALEAVEDAYEVLSDERLRHAYAAGLGKN